MLQRAQQPAVAPAQAAAPKSEVSQADAAPIGNQAQLRRLSAKMPAVASLILQRKCACGAAAASPTGECEECSKGQPRVQTKLRINEPGDAYEREAERVADQVMSASTHSPVGNGRPRIQRVGTAPISSAQRSTVLASVESTLAGPGSRLEPRLRQDMELRFGRDFNHVRIHRGTDADQSARDMNAVAYTVGHDIVFSADRFVPGTTDGRRLLAHELTHVVQQTGGPAILQMKDDPDVDAPANQPDPATDLLGALIDAIELPLTRMMLDQPALPPSRGIPALLILKQKWPVVRAWILSVGTRGTGVRAPAEFPGLAAPALVDALKTRSANERAKLADTVFDRLVSGVGSARPDVYRKEFNMLDKEVRELIEPDDDRLVGYVAMRDVLKATFGSIKALNTFYKGLVPADFPKGSGVFGADTLVHKELKAALDRAAVLLENRHLTEAVVNHLGGRHTRTSSRPFHGYWGTSIRENRNRPGTIGNHSFGFAIDINSDWNPNLQDFPWEQVQRLTGFDVYGEDFLKKANPRESRDRKFDTILAAVQQAKSASDLFRDVFESEDSLKKAMVAEALKAGAPVPPDDLFGAVADAARGGSASGPSFARVVALLSKAMSDEEARETEARHATVGSGDPHVEPPVSATIVSKILPLVKTHADLTNMMPVVQAQLDDPKDIASDAATKLHLTFLYDKAVVRELRKASPRARSYEMADEIFGSMHRQLRATEAPALAKDLIEQHRIFVGTRIASGTHAGEKISSATAGNVRTVAAHGFMNLMPELVAALTSSEGGNLQWLGAVGAHGTKDWMHFELRNPPPIVRDGKWETDPEEPQTPSPAPAPPSSRPVQDEIA